MGRTQGNIPAAAHHRFRPIKSRRECVERPWIRTPRPFANEEQGATISGVRPVEEDAPTHQQSFPSSPPVNMFMNASYFTISTQNNTFVSGDSYTIIHSTGSSKRLFDYMQQYIATGAAHNSGERCDAPKCHPETRVAVQEEIFGWITHGGADEPQRIMWVTGPAGTGKTAIAGSIAEACQAQGFLAASFFFSAFSGSLNRRLKRSFVATLAYQLAHHQGLEHFANKLLASIERDPTIFTKRLQDQADALLLEPFRDSRGLYDKAEPKVIVVDGLDEVEIEQSNGPSRWNDAERTDDEDQVEILSLLAGLAQDPSFPFRILLASRPERAIEDFLSTSDNGIAFKIFLDSQYNPDADIELFLKAKFSFIRRRYGLSSSWPGQNAIHWIVKKASGQFIYPATVIRFITNSRKLPQAQLDEIMTLKAGRKGRSVGAGKATPFAPLDQLYAHVLRASPDPRQAVTWLRLIYRIPDAPAAFWKGFLETLEGEGNHVLGNLASLVYLPPPGEARAPFRFYHQSLRDFLSDKARCKELFVDDETMKNICAERFTYILKSKKPIIPLSSEPELSAFRMDFLNSTVLFFSSFLVIKDRASVRALASCDAAWWTRLILTEQLSTADEGSIAPLEDTNAWRRRTLVELRHIMHSGCALSDRQCNAACRHWTNQTLAQAKAMDWCCEHGFEFLPVGSFYPCPQCNISS